MSDKPILFSGEMVRAILEGRKTVTRRVMTHENTLFNGRPWAKDAKAQTWDWAGAWVDPGPSPVGNAGPYLKLPWLSGESDPWEETVHRIYPRTQPGDLLWVREAHRFPDAFDGFKPSDLNSTAAVQWEADKAKSPTWRDDLQAWDNPGKLRPSMFMPRWASRITLEVTAVKVERLQDISEEDAAAEGVGVTSAGEAQGWTAQVLFKHLWDSINAMRPGCAWSDNPWVAAYTFRRIKP